MSSALLPILAGVLPAFIVLIVIFRTFGKRLGDLHRWISELSGRLEGYEKDIAQLSEALTQAQQKDPRVARLTSQLSQLAGDINKEQEALAERLSTFDQRLLELDKKLVAAPAKPVKKEAEKAGMAAVFSSPLAEEVLQLLAAGESLQDVARKTGLQVGEVELIRALKFFAGRESGARS